MDTSVEYIKMCDCEEIRGKWAKEKGDFYSAGGSIRVLFTDAFYNNGKEIWLPRQDQLQEMVEKPTLKIESSLEYLFSFFINNLTNYKTWEQSWLAFFMKEKHSKIWVENNWEDI